MPAATSRVRSLSTETDVAVLQVQVANIETKVIDLKEDIKQVREDNESSSNSIQELLREMRDTANAAHADLNKKISALEKWRWMLMGAGVVLGSIGFETIAKLLK